MNLVVVWLCEGFEKVVVGYVVKRLMLLNGVSVICIMQQKLLSLDLDAKINFQKKTHPFIDRFDTPATCFFSTR